jgi:membrane protein YdbS with pleckstrin-like domain
MNKLQSNLTNAWQDVVNLVLGIWLAVSPYVLGYADQATPAWNAYVVGVVILVIAAAAIWAFQKWEEWINAVLGLWLIVSPWILGYSEVATPLWNQIIVGVVVGGLAMWSVIGERPTGGLAHKT